jgi:hypothetical protein
MTRGPLQGPPFDISDAIHVASGSADAGTVRQAGGRRVLYSRDYRPYGPSSFNPAQHRRVRMSFWREVSPADALDPAGIVSASDLNRALNAFPPEYPIVFWSGEGWGDRLFLWWALDAISRRSHAGRGLWLASPNTRPGSKPLTSIFLCSPDGAVRLFGTARRLTFQNVRAAAVRWQHYCQRTPQRLADLQPSTHSWLNVMRDYVTFFPRAIRNRLLVSEFDEAILGGLSTTTSSTPLELLVSKRPIAVRELVLNHGDLLPLLRLEDWTNSNPLPILVRRETGQEREWTRHAYRLTSHGAHVLEHGLAKVDWAPPLRMGGHAAYDPVHPWVARRTGGRWRLHPWKPKRARSRNP